MYNPFKPILKGNAWVPGAIFGVGTIFFLYTNAQMLFTDLFNSYGSWDWKNFWVSLCTYAVFIVGAWLVAWLSR